MQNTQRQADHLQILTSRRRRHAPGLGAHIKDDAPLQPRNQKVRSFIDDTLLDTRKPVEDDGASTTLHVKQSSRSHRSTNDGRHRQAVGQVEEPRSSRHDDEGNVGELMICEERGREASELMMREALQCSLEWSLPGGGESSDESAALSIPLANRPCPRNSRSQHLVTTSTLLPPIQPPGRLRENETDSNAYGWRRA